MAYKLNKYGQQVKDDLDAVEEKTIYPDATPANKGLMTTEHIQRLSSVERCVEEEGETLTAYEIMMICR